MLAIIEELLADGLLMEALRPDQRSYFKLRSVSFSGLSG